MQEITQSNALSGDSEVERLAREVAELRAARAADRAELAAVRAQVMRQQASPAPAAPLGERPTSAKRRLSRRRPTGSGEGESSGVVSRRRLFGLLGGAAVAGTGLAVLGSATDPAQATTGNLVFGTSNDAGTASTSLTSSSTSGTFSTNNTGNATGLSGMTGSATGVLGQTGTGLGVRGTALSTGAGIAGDSEAGYSGQFIAPSANIGGAHLFLGPGLFAGPPTSASHVAGEVWMDASAVLWQCVAAGTPGTWINLSPLVPVSPPVRVLDTRTNGGPLGNNAQRDVTVIGTFGSSVIPSGISSVLCNLTAAEPTGAGFLAMFEQNTTWSGTSNLNFNPGQDISNNATSAVSTSGKVTVRNGGPATNFIIDVFGYYP